MASSNATKIAINNEIVLMRQAVRQSRVAVVRKLIKEAKLLQARKHGNEKVQEKCHRKAVRLLAEIAAVKKLKDDEISKFGVANNEKLAEVLADSSTSPATRIMTRLAVHKILGDRITEFKKKFPDYEEHLGPGRKKLSKMQRETDRKVRKALRKGAPPPKANGAIADVDEKSANEIADATTNVNSKESGSDECEKNDDSADEIEASGTDETENDEADEINDSLAAEHGLKPGSILRINAPESTTKKRKFDAVDCSPTKNPKTPKTPKKVQNPVEPKIFAEKTVSQSKLADESIANPKNKKNERIDSKATAEPKKLRPVKIVSREATVKRFADLADDDEPNELSETAESVAIAKKRDAKIEKEVDSFFMTENGDGEYLSVVVPRPKPCEDVEEDDGFGRNHAAQRQKSFHERNNKFFSKIDRRANPGHGDGFAGRTDGRSRKNDFGNNVGGASERFGRNSNGPARESRNGKTNVEKKIDSKDEELHPSWAARKKQQEILKQGFQGKKIVFDD